MPSSCRHKAACWCSRATPPDLCVNCRLRERGVFPEPAWCIGAADRAEVTLLGCHGRFRDKWVEPDIAMSWQGGGDCGRG